MSTAPAASAPANLSAIRWLAYLLFLTFAMTTDSAGVIIPAASDELRLSLTAAGGFHYVTMLAIAVAGAGLGGTADRLGRRAAIVLGLAAFALGAFLCAATTTYLLLMAWLAVSGTGIALFKTGALALVGDISRSTREHTATTNTIEGFFAVGAIVGPALVTWLVAASLSWRWLYVVAGTMAVGLMALAMRVHAPAPAAAGEPVRLDHVVRIARDRHAAAFSAAVMLYVAVEAAVYVWLPTLLAGRHGLSPGLAGQALTAFFVLRAVGRFAGARLLGAMTWQTVLMTACGGILVCLGGAVVGGPSAAAWLLPLSGLFMSVVYPTLNSKGISCFSRTQHGAVAGVLLFFTCLGAVLGPLAMGILGDATGQPLPGFILAAGLAGLLFAGAVWNWIADPAGPRLLAHDVSDYG